MTCRQESYFIQLQSNCSTPPPHNQYNNGNFEARQQILKSEKVTQLNHHKENLHNPLFKIGCFCHQRNVLFEKNFVKFYNCIGFHRDTPGWILNSDAPWPSFKGGSRLNASYAVYS